MRFAHLLLACLLLCLPACGRGLSLVGGASPDAGRGDVGFDAGGAPTFDVQSSDVPLTPDVGRGDAAQTCASNGDCERGQRCLQGRCTEDVCLASETACGNDRCDMRCVPVRDLCADAHCEAGETCFGGSCIPGCFPSPCAGVQCPAGQFCDDSRGTCALIRPCPAHCDDGFACHLACLPHTPCDSVSCPSNQVCADGACVSNPCAGVSCAAGSVCIDGRCTDTCACDTPCDRSPRDRCLVGRCSCDRTCTATTPCGADDGCGGHCVGPCENPNAHCDPVRFSCECVPLCDTDHSCGQDDGCGGHCADGCAAGERCDATLGHCVCVPRCPAPSTFSSVFCGVPILNVCPDGPVCGSGTMCHAANEECDMGLARCICVGLDCPPPDIDDPMGGDPDGGVACPVGLSACEGHCVNTQTNNNYCGDCRGHCPPATTCIRGMCSCPAGTTLCGARCVDTQTENANCGTCGTLCAAGLSCQAGRCQCATACTVDLNAVACGTNVPNPCPGGPSCGFGRLCPAGQGCDIRTRTCVCVPRCPAGVTCGVSDGCGGQCVGSCAAGSTCTQDTVDPQHFFCSDAGCAAGCRCDEVCSMNRCVQVTCAAGDRPCPCQCCPFGQMCVGGSVCAVIPP